MKGRIFSRPRDCKKYSPYTHYQMKKSPSDLGNAGGFVIYTPKYEHGR
jgi:hypothetical protein